MAVARERIRLVPVRSMPWGNSTPLGNAAINILPVINVDVIRPLFTVPVIVLTRLNLLAICSRTSISSIKDVSISLNFFKCYVCGSCGAAGF